MVDSDDLPRGLPTLSTTNIDANDRAVERWILLRFKGLTNFTHTTPLTKAKAVQFVLKAACDGWLSPVTAENSLRYCIQEAFQMYDEAHEYNVRYDRADHLRDEVSPALMLGLRDDQAPRPRSVDGFLRALVNHYSGACRKEFVERVQR